VKVPDHRSRLLLVEGVPGLGKSTVLDHLARRHVAEAEPRRVRTLLHLTQAHTYGPLARREDAGTLTRGECLAHLERIVAGLEWLAASVRGESTTKCFVLVDCLHLTACLRPGVVRWPDVVSLDRRMAETGCRLLLLDGTDETVRERAVRARMDTDFIRGYAARRFGRSEAELVRHFRRERDAFRELFAASAMTRLCLPAEAPEEATAAGAFRFWKDHGWDGTKEG
jgi:thymidylate kinase